MRGARAAAIGGPVAGLLLLRFLALRSAPHLVYHGEFAGIGRLQREIATGVAQFDSLSGFIHGHTYQYFAQGTVLLQVVAAALHPIFGPTLQAQWAAGVVLEALTVGLLAATLLRVTTPGFAALGATLLVLPPRFLAFFAMQPYGNHTAMLFAPMAMAFWLAGRGPDLPRWRQVLPLSAGLILSVLLYRLHVVPVLALLGVLALGGPRGQRFAAVVGTLTALGLSRAFVWLGLRPTGLSYDGVGSFPAEAPVWERVPQAVAFLWGRGLSAVELGDGGTIHRVVMLAAVLGAGWMGWRGARGARRGTEGGAAPTGGVEPGERATQRVAAFAALWAVGTLLAPVLAGSSRPRYWIPAFAACALALAVVAASRRGRWRQGAAAVMAALALVGFLEVRPYIDPATWERTARFPGAELWWELEVDSVDLDELPYYQRILLEKRGSRHVGLASHTPSNDCPLWPGSGPDRPEPAADHCHGWGEGELVASFGREAARLSDPAARVRAMEDGGRGAWIRADRSVPRVELALRGAPPEVLGPAMVGARDEAARWADR